MEIDLGLRDQEHSSVDISMFVLRWIVILGFFWINFHVDKHLSVVWIVLHSLWITAPINQAKSAHFQDVILFFLKLSKHTSKKQENYFFESLVCCEMPTCLL